MKLIYMYFKILIINIKINFQLFDLLKIYIFK
jgi:hypothetical protein